MAQSFKQRDGLFASVDCASWDDFKIRAPLMLREFAGTEIISDRYLFRGQSCSSWGLSSSFDRVSDHLNRGERDKLYRTYIQSFGDNYRFYGNLGNSNFSEKFQDFDKLNPLQIEAVAQHFGLGTKLLDWSRSIYVGAFFAVSKIGLCASGMVSVWALDCEILEQFSETDLAFIEDFYRGNIRNLWQMGAFLRNLSAHDDLAKLFKTDSKFIDTNVPNANPALIRFDFPASDETIILDDLQMMRINSMTIFPGMEGVVGWIKRKNGM